jgi:hypothetical protein
MVVRLDDPQPVFTLPSIDDIPDEADDQPEPGLSLVSSFAEVTSFEIILRSACSKE